LTVKEGSQSPVTVNVSASTTSLVSTAKDFVSAYNSLRDTLDKTTVYNPDDKTTGILFGTQAALRVESELSHIITSRFFGVGKYQALETLGISLDDKGMMSLDESKLTTAFNQNPAELKKFFTNETLGASKKIFNVVEQLAGKNDSLLSSRSKALTDTIDANHERLDDMTARLDHQRELLLAQFESIETTVANLQSNLTALTSLQIIPPLTSGRSN
jgi:flagellar hook-associated protein 2